MNTKNTQEAKRRLAAMPGSVTLAMGCASERIATQLKEQGLKCKASDARLWQRLADAICILYIHRCMTECQMNQGRQKLLKRIAKGCSQNDQVSNSHPDKTL
jgi:tagatose-1,6-bisphosphate aldolase